MRGFVHELLEHKSVTRLNRTQRLPDPRRGERSPNPPHGAKFWLGSITVVSGAVGSTAKKFCCLALFVSVVTLVTSAVSTQQSTNTTNSYIGDDKCLSCHKDKNAYSRTAHHLTSQSASRNSIAGNFSPGKNILRTSEAELHYRMEARSDGFYQTGVLGTPPDTVSLSERFDLVIGSGRKGQTYLYWGKGDELFQLPVSYWTSLNSWVNSPGYDDRLINFSRPVPPRCLECHASSFESIANANAQNRYRKSNYVLGISCEKCHGPGAQHERLNVPNGAKPKDQAIINPARLTREQQLGLCALCHGGVGVAKAPAFSFTVGQTLADYIQLETPKPGEALDVHGNQLALLERSRCFKSSTMTCSTCHDVHLPQREVKDFSERCLSCHKVQSCGLFAKKGQAINGKCVDCHIPNQDSNVIVSSHDGVRVRPKVRNHWIKVYPELTNLP